MKKEHSVEKLHESEDQLELYALDRLGETEIRRVEEHLIICEGCRDRLESSAQFAFAIKTVLKQHPEPAQKQAAGWLSWIPAFTLGRPAFAMATVALIITSAAFLIGSRISVGPALIPVASLHLMAMRGEMQDIRTAREFDVTLIDPGAGGAPFRVEVVDAVGSPQWSGAPKVVGTGLNARIPKALAAGTYFTRLYDSNGKLLHEYGFRVLNP